jgi:hypothetical protein
MLTIAHILLAAAAFTGWALFVLVSPHRRCTWCKGTKRSRRHRWFGRMGKCPRCRNGRHHRLGAGYVHAFFWLVLGDQLRERRKERLSAKAKERL